MGFGRVQGSELETGSTARERERIQNYDAAPLIKNLYTVEPLKDSSGISIFVLCRD